MLQQASLQSTENKILSDIATLSKDLQAAQDEANRQAGCFQTILVFKPSLLQGALDIQYLQNRFEKGKTKVEQFMAKKHRYVTLSSLTDVHADLAGWLPSAKYHG